MALTPKEREVLELAARNLSNKEIGLAMQVGEETIKWHMKNLFAKLDAGTRKQVVQRARILGLLETERLSRAHPPPRWGGRRRAARSLTLSPSKGGLDGGLDPGDKPMTTATPQSPAVVRAASLPDSIKVEPLTCAIGAELSNVNLGVASRDPALVAEIRALLLKHRVLFFRDQDITRAEHVAFARHFGELEDHPVAGSDPEHPGLVRIYKSPDTPERPLRERLAHRRHLAREAAASAACCAASSARRWAATRCGPTWCWPTSGCPSTSRRRSPACARATASRPASAPRCRSRSAWR